MRFFLDCNMAAKLARMLDHYDTEHSVQHHNDRFDEGTQDTQWLRAIYEDDSSVVVVSGDGRILENPAELQVLKDSNLTFFMLAKGWTNMKWSDQAWKMVKIWPEVIRSASQQRYPTIYKIPVSSNKIEVIKKTRDL